MCIFSTWYYIIWHNFWSSFNRYKSYSNLKRSIFSWPWSASVRRSSLSRDQYQFWRLSQLGIFDPSLVVYVLKYKRFRLPRVLDCQKIPCFFVSVCVCFFCCFFVLCLFFSFYLLNQFLIFMFFITNNFIFILRVI